MKVNVIIQFNKPLYQLAKSTNKYLYRSYTQIEIKVILRTFHFPLKSYIWICFSIADIAFEWKMETPLNNLHLNLNLNVRLI